MTNHDLSLPVWMMLMLPGIAGVRKQKLDACVPIKLQEVPSPLWHSQHPWTGDECPFGPVA